VGFVRGCVGRLQVVCSCVVRCACFVFSLWCVGVYFVVCSCVVI